MRALAFSHRLSSVPFPFCLSSGFFPFRFFPRDIHLHEGSVNASFGAEDGLQQLQTVADDSSYESASTCEAARVCNELW